MFIYIAASDLLPELHHSHTRREWIYAVPFFVGVALIAAISVLIPDDATGGPLSTGRLGAGVV